MLCYVGNGVFATSKIEKGECLTFYTGELITEEEAVRREAAYSVSDGSFMYFFKCGRKLLWLVVASFIILF